MVQKRYGAQIIKSFSIYPEDFVELSAAKEKTNLTWSAFFKLLLAEHKQFQGENK